MKKQTLLYGFILIILSACQDNLLINETNSSAVSIQAEDIYPSSINFKAKGRSLSFENNWENMDQAPTALVPIDLPWGIYGDGNIPEDIAEDIKKEDGWKFIYHTFNSYNPKKRYMIFYNQRTGVLKVFYHLDTSQYETQAGSWDVKFNFDQTYMNISQELALPNHLNGINYWSCTNLVQQGTKGFQNGWNCFMVQLAYSSGNTTESNMDILSHALDTTAVNLFGNSYSHSKGTIISHGSTNELSSLVTGFADVFGKSAETYFESKKENDSLKSNNANSRALLSGLGGELIKWGANKVFTKLTASFNEPTTTRADLDFSTTGELNLTGSLRKTVDTPAISARVDLNKNLVGELGVWNLANQPIIYIDPRADHVPDPMDDAYGEYTYRMRGISRYAYNLQINPELTPYIKNQWVDIDLVRYYHASDRPQIPNMFSFGTLGSNYKGFGGGYYTTDKLIYKEHMGEGSMYDEFFDDYTFYTRQSFHDTYGAPLPIVFAPNVESYEGKKFESTNLFMKFSLYLVTEFEGKRDTTVSTRTFIPQIEWDPTLYNALKDVDMRNLGYYEHLK